MGMYMAFVVVGIPCIVFVLFCLTPKGRRWMRQNNML